jgi:hypothetical protein
MRLKRGASDHGVTNKNQLKKELKVAMSNFWSPQKEQVDAILLEAGAHNLRAEVKASAESFMAEDPGLDEANAYNMAYVKWITE